jgi:hypothetical protein
MLGLIGLSSLPAFVSLHSVPVVHVPVFAGKMNRPLLPTALGNSGEPAPALLPPLAGNITASEREPLALNLGEEPAAEAAMVLLLGNATANETDVGIVSGEEAATNVTEAELVVLVEENNSTAAGNATNTTQPISAAEVTGARAALSLHNEYRTRHQVGSLGWSSDAEATARAWARVLAGDDCSMYHSSRDQRNGYGENLAIGHSNIKDVVDDWYNEVEDYDFGDPGFSMGTGHFTQIVWGGTNNLGCAIATCPEGGRTPGRRLYVCHYDPPGNIQNRFQENVFPDTSS